MELTNVKPSEVTFEEELFQSPYSLIYLVTIRGTTCVMKLLHNDFEEGAETFRHGRQTSQYLCEFNAYQRMKAHGLCDRGIIPQFYGTMKHLNPDLYRPYLDVFRNDASFPDAILIEYISGAEQLSRINYTSERMDKFIEYLEDIHRAAVLHCDIHPRNMWIFPDSVDRVVWLDFNRAQTYEEHELSDRQQGYLVYEGRQLTELRDAFDSDIKEGRINRLAIWYGVRPEPMPS